MALVMDPAGAEISALRKIIHWGSKQVLEVGCGDGRLTLRLAGLGAEKIRLKANQFDVVVFSWVL